MIFWHEKLLETQLDFSSFVYCDLYLLRELFMSIIRETYTAASWINLLQFTVLSAVKTCNSIYYFNSEFLCV